MCSRTRSGFTLVELLVVIAIIGVLVALLIPAVQAARETARKATCTTRQRELAQAVSVYEGAKHHYPGAHGLVARDAASPLSIATSLGGAGGGPNKVCNWNVLLLPYLDQQQLFDRWDDRNTNIDSPQLTQPVPIFTCPSRQTRFRLGPYTSYVANAGCLPLTTDPAPLNSAAQGKGAASATNYWARQQGYNGVFVDRVPTYVSGTALNGLLPREPPEVTTTDVYDGLSNTLLFSENLMGGEWGRSHPDGLIRPRVLNLNTVFMWFYRTDGAVSCTPPPAPPAPPAPLSDMRINERLRQYSDPTQFPAGTYAFIARPSSFHSGGVNVVYADMHTGFLNNRLDYDVYQQLMTANSRRSDSYTRCYVLRASDIGE